jgi:hypothetical protein
MSILNAPVEERLGPWRVAFGLHNDAWLSEETRRLVRRQIRLLAAMKPEELVKIARQLGKSRQVASYLEGLGGFENVVHALAAPG